MAEAEEIRKEYDNNKRGWYFEEESDLKKRLWLECYAKTRNIGYACQTAGVSRRTVYNWQHQEGEEGDRFRERYSIAYVIASDVRRERYEEIFQERIENPKAPMSSLLLMMGLKREDKEYRDNPPEEKQIERNIKITIEAPPNFRKGEVVEGKVRELPPGG